MVDFSFFFFFLLFFFQYWIGFSSQQIISFVSNETNESSAGSQQLVMSSRRWFSWFKFSEWVILNDLLVTWDGFNHMETKQKNNEPLARPRTRTTTPDFFSLFFSVEKERPRAWEIGAWLAESAYNEALRMASALRLAKLNDWLGLTGRANPHVLPI